MELQDFFFCGPSSECAFLYFLIYGFKLRKFKMRMQELITPSYIKITKEVYHLKEQTEDYQIISKYVLKFRHLKLKMLKCYGNECI